MSTIQLSLLKSSDPAPLTPTQAFPLSLPMAVDALFLMRLVERCRVRNGDWRLKRCPACLYTKARELDAEARCREDSVPLIESCGFFIYKLNSRVLQWSGEGSRGSWWRG